MIGSAFREIEGQQKHKVLSPHRLVTVCERLFRERERQDQCYPTSLQVVNATRVDEIPA